MRRSRTFAEGIRTAIGNFRDQRSDRREIQAQPRTELEPRYLDAAIAGEIPVGMTREVAALVRIGESQGLSAVLSSTDASRSQYSCSPSDVRSEPFDARYQVMDRARTSPTYRLTVDLIVEDEDKHFTIEWGRDSITFKFFVKANRAGEQRLRVNLYAGTLAAAELLLKTRAGGSPPPGGVIKKMDRLVASVQLMLNVINRSASAGSA